MPESELLDARDKRALNELLSADSTVEVVIPPDMQPKKLHETLVLCCRGYLHVRNMMARLKPLIGRGLVLAQDNPESYRQFGHKTFEEYLQREICSKYHMSRTDCYDSMRIARTFPDLTPERATAIRSSKLLIAAKATSQGNSNREEILDNAERMPLGAFTKYCEEAGLSDADGDKVMIVIPATRAIEEAWTALSTNADVHAIVGTSNPGEVFQCAIAEALSSWQGQNPQ